MTDELHFKMVEKTYRAIGKFIFEISQFEYAIRHYVAEEVGVMIEYFDAIMPVHDLCCGGDAASP